MKKSYNTVVLIGKAVELKDNFTALIQWENVDDKHEMEIIPVEFSSTLWYNLVRNNLLTNGTSLGIKGYLKMNDNHLVVRASHVFTLKDGDYQDENI